MLQKIKKKREQERNARQGNKGRDLSLIRPPVYLSSFSLSLSLLIIESRKEVFSLLYLSGMNLDDVVDPIPALPCLTGLYEIENSPR